MNAARSSGALHRIAAVVRADLLIRVRRTSTIVLLLVLCVGAYSVVPNLADGRAMIVVDGHRSLYDSATISMVTAAVGGVFLGMLGFYVVSSAVRHDITTRTGLVIAAMPVRSIEYLTAKFLGNVAFLSVVVLGYIANVMVMHLVRGETGINPLVYLSTYAAVIGPAIFIVSALALLFECVRPLSGRLGDVVYFFVWLAMMGLAAGGMEGVGQSWHDYADVFGMPFMKKQISQGLNPHSISIGVTNFDAAKSIFVFPGIRWSWHTIAPRIGTAALALPILILAGLAFPRFDPAKTKVSAGHGRFNPLASINGMLKPLTRFLAPLAGVQSGFARLVVAEIALGFMLSPVALLFLAGVSIAALIAPPSMLMHSVLPFTFLGLVAAISDIAPRDDSAGTTPLLRTMPRMREHYLPVKLAATAGTTLLFVAIALVRLTVTAPLSALSLLVGAFFVGAAASSLGLLTRGPKAFAGGFLLFLYAVVRSTGAPAMDFAGFNGDATSTVRLAYAAAATVFVIVTLATRHWSEER